MRLLLLLKVLSREANLAVVVVGVVVVVSPWEIPARPRSLLSLSLSLKAAATPVDTTTRLRSRLPSADAKNQRPAMASAGVLWR